METIRDLLVSVGLLPDAQDITESPLESNDETRLKVSRQADESVQDQWQRKCCVNILPQNMEKHLKSKKHLKFASDSGPGSGGRREGAGRKPKETVSFDR
jgi:hypothetical protein